MTGEPVTGQPAGTPELYRLIHAPSQTAVADIRRARNWWEKGRGVIGWRTLPAGEGLWLPDAGSIHTFFVRFPLDILFLDRDLATVAVRPAVPPWRPLVWARGVRHTIELGAGTLSRVAARPGDRWELRPV